MVTFGSSTNDEVSFNLRKFFYGQYTLLGSTMGSREELHELLDFIDKHQLKPLIDRGFPFEQIYKAFDYLESQQQLGKVYIDFGKDK
ncbi:zinc-binding dehydrogenase [Gracilibacillus boraciitolerans]